VTRDFDSQPFQSDSRTARLERPDPKGTMRLGRARAGRSFRYWGGVITPTAIRVTPYALLVSADTGFAETARSGRGVLKKRARTLRPPFNVSFAFWV
jgi:hypothetical protein